MSRMSELDQELKERALTPEKLYEMYQDGQDQLNNCTTDQFEDLEPSEQAVWRFITDRVHDHIHLLLTGGL